MPVRSAWMKWIGSLGKIPIVPLLVALFLVPAAVVVALYPMNWILGTVTFYTTSISIAPFRMFLLLPILIGFMIAQHRRDWLLAAMLLPGIALAISAPDRLGSYEPDRGDSKAFYPENYSSQIVESRIQTLEFAIRDIGWLMQVLPLDLPSIEGLQTSQKAAALSVGAWRNGTETDATRAGLETALAEAQEKKTKVQSGTFGGRGGAKSAALRAVNKQIRDLTAQLDQMKSGTTAGDLYPAAVSATSTLKVDLEQSERLVAEKISFFRALPYIVTSAIAFALFVLKIGFLNWAMALLAAGTALAGIWQAWPLSFDDRAIAAPLALYPAIICVLSAFVLRFFYRSFLDNCEVAQGFSRADIFRSIRRTILVWMPFPLVMGGLIALNNNLYNYAASAIYCDDSTLPFCGHPSYQSPIYDSDPARDTLRDDINSAIQRAFAKFEAEAVSGAESARSNVAAQVEAVKKQVDLAFNKVLPENLYQIFPDLEPPSSCSFLLPDLECFAKQIVLDRLNSAYQSPRKRLKTRIDNALADAGRMAEKGVASAADGLEGIIKGEADAAAQYATKSVDATFVGFNIASVVQMALMLLVTMRAFLLVFGRMLYRDVHNHLHDPVAKYPYFELTHTESSRSGGSHPTVEAYNNEYELGPGEHLPLLTKRAHNVDDADQSTLLFRAHYPKWTLRRLANGCLFLTEVNLMPGKKSIRFSTVGGRQLVVWKIPADAEIFFRWDKFVAMSACMRLKKTISLRIGGLTMGTTMHASVVGPGLLIQQSGGQVELSQVEQIPGSVVADRLMSWEVGAKYQIRSPKPLASVYLDPPSLDAEPGSRAVANASDRPGWGLGLLRELCRLFRP